LKSLSPVTVREDVKILSAAFTVARKQGLIYANPCEAVDLPKGESLARGTFTPMEVGLLLDAAADEWRTVILLSFYAGMRLGDAVSLKWENVNFAEGSLSYRASKTKSHIEIPMHPALQKHLESIAGDSMGEVSPTLAGRKVPGRSGLSHQFMQVMRSAGIDAEQIRGHKSRIFSRRSFHSLRHTFVSQMANAGVAPELRQKLAGHSSGGSHRKYTHLELQTLRAAIEELPAQ
jgi:integrase